MFRNRLYLAVVSGHFAIDVLNSLVPVLMAVLAVPLGLTNAQIGLALTIYLLANSLSQPVFGWLADRVAHRSIVLAGIGVIWVALFFCAIAFMQHWVLLLVCFLLAPLGSALFHPIGTASAAAAMPGRANSATAVFFFCGQMGLASGPVLGGLLLGRAGSLGVLPLALLALIPAGLLFVARNDGRSTTRNTARDARMQGGADAQQQGSSAAGTSSQRRPAGAIQWLSVAVVAFVLLVAVRSSIQTAFQAFLPKLFADRGWEPAVYGLLAGTFMGASAIGNVLMGGLADRFGMRAATFWPLLLSVPAGLLCLANLSLPVTFIAGALAGVLVGGQHSVLVVHAQRLLPAGQQFAAGLILGFTFASGAIGAWLVGMAADVYSLPVVMQGVALCGLLAALLTLSLPGHMAARRQRPEARDYATRDRMPEGVDAGQVIEPRTPHP